MASIPGIPESAPHKSRRIGIAFSQRRESAQQAAERARLHLESLGAQVLTLQEVLEGHDVEALLAIGGDGTLLHAARLMAIRRIPVMGVNFGHVGYLCAAREDQLDESVEALFHRTFAIETRSMARARVFNRHEEVWQVDALNEVSIGGSNRTLTLELSINGEHLGLIRGDGVIVSTRTGSTAYAFSAGGPALLVEALVLVTSNPVASSITSPVVCPLDTVVRIVNRTNGTRPYVIADGQKDYQIEDGTEIEIGLSPVQAYLADPGLITSVGKLKKGDIHHK